MKKTLTTIYLGAISVFTCFGQGETCATAQTVTFGNYTANGPSSGNGASTISGHTHADWYQFTPASSTTVTISSCGSGGDTRLFVHTGTCAGLANEADEDDGCDGNESLTMSVTGGVTYYIEWTDEWSNSGFDMSITEVTQPITTAGDDCANAVSITTGTYFTDGPSSGSGASTTSGDINSDWYKFTPTSSGDYTIGSCESGVDTRLFIFDGSCGFLNNLYDVDDNCGFSETQTVSMTAGTTYYFEWSDAYSSSGFEFTLAAGTVGIEDEMLNSVSVFPSPTTGELTIDLGEIEGQETNIGVFNSSGVNVLSTNATATTRLDLSDYPSGVYNVIITGDQGYINRKVVKE